jgi:acyl carrier protein
MAGNVTMKDKNEIYEGFVRIMVEDFEIERESIAPDAHLYEQLGLDSIDAVDLIVKLQELVGKKISPAAFKQVRTVNDAVCAIDNLIQQK